MATHSTPSARTARLVLVVSVSLLAAYVVIWAQIGHVGIGRSDFTAFYAGATLVRDGHAAAAYDPAVQGALRSRLIAPDQAANIPFNDAPVAAALVLPFTLLSLDTAYRLWTLLQLAILVIAVIVAVRSAPWPATATSLWKTATGAAAIAGIGTWLFLIQGQWGALTALGLALAYRDWRSGRSARGGFWLTIAAGIAKPHLAIGLAAFLIGWRNRRAIMGALAALVTLIGLSVAVVGPAGVAAFVKEVASQTGQWELRRMASFVGIPGSFLGSTTTAQLVGAAGTAVACVLAWRLGWLLRRDARLLPVALAGAAVLSLLAAPHAYAQDLVMLAPALVWTTAWFSQPRDEREPRQIARALAPVGVWALISAAAFGDVIKEGVMPPGQLTAWALILAAAMTWLALRRPASVSAPVAPGGSLSRPAPA